MKRSILFLVISIFIFACGSQDTDKKSEKAPEKIPVEVMKVDEKAMPSLRTFQAAVSSDKIAVITPKIVGHIENITVNPGSKVKKGDLLVSIKSEELEDKRRFAQAAVDEADSANMQAKIGLNMAKSQLRQAEFNFTLTERTYNRYKNLLAKESVSQQEFDQVQAKYQLAKEQKQIAAENVSLSEQKVNQVALKRRQAKSMLAEVATYVSYTKIRAPFDGVILEKKMDIGNLASPGTVILKLGNEKSVIYTRVSESLITEIKIGTDAHISAPSANVEYDTKVLEVSPDIDMATRTFQVKMGGHDSLVNGMYAKVRFETGRTDIILIPQSAVVERGQINVVYVDANKKAEMRVVKTGRTIDKYVEILSGLTIGETVVIKNANVLKNGVILEY